MKKLWLIIRREYLTRVTKKTFILTTLLAPLGIGLIMFISGYIASQSSKSDTKVMVVDQNHSLESFFDENETLKFDFVSKSIEEAKKTYRDEGYDMLVIIPPLTDLKTTSLNVGFYSEKKPSLISLKSVESKIEDAFEKYKKEKSGIGNDVLAQLKMNISLENAAKDSDESAGDKSSKLSIAISSVLSYVMGFLMYIVIFVYGGMVMRSVMEEKINRIVEVIISSVKPFTLMLGKIIGVGLVGLTQLVIWLVLLAVIMAVMGQFFAPDVQMTKNAAEVMAQAQAQGLDIQKILTEIGQLNWWLILPSFIVFFLGGYFIYASLFAAIGSAIGDDLGESQQLMIPITIPVILAFVMIPSVFNNPDGGMAVFGSMFPLFSPIIMPARLPFDPPLWQVVLSMLILVSSVAFFAWIAGRIYRIGILMYGKKVTFKELWKWMFY